MFISYSGPYLTASYVGISTVSQSQYHIIHMFDSYLLYLQVGKFSLQ